MNTDTTRDATMRRSDAADAASSAGANGANGASSAAANAANGADKVYSSAFNEKNTGRDRDERGRLLPGHSVKGGRPPRRDETRYVAALERALSPEQFQEWALEALSIAQRTNSARGITDVLKLILAYTAGKPTQRLQLQELATPEQWLAAIAAGDDAPDDAP